MRSYIVTPENWLDWRKSGIGGSDAPVLMNCSPWMTPQELIQIKTGQLQPQPATFVMKRGLRMEPHARAAYELDTRITMPRRLLANKELPFILGSFDGLNTDVRRALEIKCPGRVDHQCALNGQIPKKYIWQCVHLAMLCGYKELDYWSYWIHNSNVRNALVTYRRDNRLEKMLLEEEKRFWKEVLKVFNQMRPRHRETSKEIPMKNLMKPPQSPAYTAKEVVEILERAKQLGVVDLRLEGFEATFDVRTFGTRSSPPDEPTVSQQEREPSPRATRPHWDFPVRRSSAPRAERIHQCARCNSSELESWMSLCPPCFQESRPSREYPRRRRY